MIAELERRIPLAGLYNFRDLGGYRAADGRSVRWRRLFRSDGHEKLTQEDIATLRELGIATVIDLRTDEELEQTGRSPLHDGEVTLHCHVPYIRSFESLPEPAAPGIVGNYLRDTSCAGDCIAELFAMLADERRYPAVYHCFAGKDRTGMISALILRTLGVDDEQIIADYALTDSYLTEWMAQARARGETTSFDEVEPEFLSARPESMTAFLAGVDERYGST
ncbi:MAG: tyrosine-protein phosphatase, partial [Thermomicrobiales bacterium]